MIIITILMMVLFFKVMGVLFRIGWKIMGAVAGFIGFLIVAGLVISFVGAFLLPVIAVIGLVVLLTRSAKKG